MNGHLGKQHSSVTLELRCQSALRAHVRYSTLRAQGLLASRPEWRVPFSFRAVGATRVPPCIWRFLNRLPRTRGEAQRSQ